MKTSKRGADRVAASAVLGLLIAVAAGGNGPAVSGAAPEQAGLGRRDEKGE